MKRMTAIIFTVLAMLCFTGCTNGGNINDSTSGGVVSDVMSKAESTISKVSSGLNSMMSKMN